MNLLDQIIEKNVRHSNLTSEGTKEYYLIQINKDKVSCSFREVQYLRSLHSKLEELKQLGFNVEFTVSEEGKINIILDEK